MAANESVQCGAASSETVVQIQAKDPQAKDTQRIKCVLPNPLTDQLKQKHMRRGVLIPLKTNQEVRQDHVIVQALITRAPTKIANDVLLVLKELQPSKTTQLSQPSQPLQPSQPSQPSETAQSAKPENSANPLLHLRRCAKPMDLPAHIKTQFMNDTPEGRQIHTTKSNWIYIIIGEAKDFEPEELIEALSKIEGVEKVPFLSKIPVPLLAPTSQVQAAMWTSQFWPTVYRKNNPLGPHPGIVARGTDEIRDDCSLWMALAHRVAMQAKKAGIGEAMGAVIVHRGDAGAELVGLAGDARWHQGGGLGIGNNTMSHCVLRAISMVAQKLVRHERRTHGQPMTVAHLEYDAFQDSPLLEMEKECFSQEHPSKDGYLCHGLELYVTHEPCVACSMGILHSRMGRAVFCKHMPRTGGLSSDDRPDGGGRGLGLFWRRELNWSLLAWEWERDGVPNLPPIDPTTHV